jgi:Kef-type K+ transport system membrane component KefB
MALNELHSLLLIFTIAAVAPLVCEWVPRIRLPLVVAEIGLGVLVGPQALGWAAAGPTIPVLANFGLAFLFFRAGFEIDLPAIRGRPLLLAALGWLASLVVCLGVGFGLQGCGVVDSGLIVGAALATTALGTLMPILRDAQELPTRFGAYAVASGAMGEFGPILLIALVLSSGEGERGSALVLMLVFTVIIVTGAYIALRFRPPRVILLLQEKMHTSAQLPVRLAILVLASLVILARDLGLDAILGALAAGIVVALASPGEHRKALRHKLEGIGFGFFVPIFFVTTGLRYDWQALISSRLALLQLPVPWAVPCGSRSARVARASRTGPPVTNRPRLVIGHPTAAGRRHRGDWRQVRPAQGRNRRQLGRCRHGVGAVVPDRGPGSAKNGCAAASRAIGSCHAR